jgi:hypothetical protein
LKLNGWEKIGIIASLAWILGAGLHTLHAQIRDASKTIASDRVACDSDLSGMTDEAKKKASEACNEHAQDALAAATVNARLIAVMVALLPVPVGWGVGYFGPFLAVWARRGSSHRH